MKKFSLFLVVGLIAISFSQGEAFAAHKRCGLGSKLFGKKKTVLSQSSEISTNNLSSGDTSITYGTSGCKHDGHYIIKGFGMNETDQLDYVDSNFEELTLQMAQGSGEYVDGLAYAMGCPRDVYPAFQSMIHTQYESIAGATDSTPMSVLNQAKKSVTSDPTLSKACTARIDG